MTNGFRTAMTTEAFFARFPLCDVLGGYFGRWVDDDRSDGLELIHFYYTNDAGDVGEACYDRRTTCERYFLIEGEAADMTKYTYRKAAA